MEWGVYGVPETFIVGRDGKIAYKLVGPITEANLERVIKPEIEKALAPGRAFVILRTERAGLISTGRQGRRRHPCVTYSPALLALGLMVAAPAVTTFVAVAFAQDTLIDINTADKATVRSPAWHRRRAIRCDHQRPALQGQERTGDKRNRSAGCLRQDQGQDHRQQVTAPGLRRSYAQPSPAPPAPPRVPQSGPRKCSRRGTCPRARGSRARRRRRSPRPRPPRRRRAAARRRLQHARRQIGLQPAERLAREHRELHGDQRPGRGIEDPVRLRHADELVAEIVARRADRHHLRVLAELVVDLAVARHDLALELGGIDQVAAARAGSCRRPARAACCGRRNRRRAP